MSRPSDLGDGPLCPESPMHGKTYIIPTGDGVTELCWCPVTQGRFLLVGGHDAGPRYVPAPVLHSGGNMAYRGATRRVEAVGSRRE